MCKATTYPRIPRPLIVIAWCELPKISNRNSAQPSVSRLGTVYSNRDTPVLPSAPYCVCTPNVKCVVVPSRATRMKPGQTKTSFAEGTRSAVDQIVCIWKGCINYCLTRKLVALMKLSEIGTSTVLDVYIISQDTACIKISFR